MKTVSFLIASTCILFVGFFGIVIQGGFSLSCEIDKQGNCVSEPDILPPLKQFKSGVILDEIFCHPNMILIVKQNTETPACVFNSDKLIERGWGIKISELESSTSQPATPIISLEYTPCFGFCPTYTVSIHEDGSVNYVGYENVQKIGTIQSSITKTQLDSILEKINQINFYEFDDEYGAEITDIPRIVFSVNLNDDVKSIKSPSHTMPEQLKELEILIVNLIDISQYVGDDKIPVEQSDIITFYIHSKLVDCVGVGPQKCMQVKQNPDSSWEWLYQGIEGFDFQEGIEYKIRVVVEEVKNPPADGSSLRYVLHEILEPVSESNLKRMSVSVPDATYENDMFCQTSWNIVTFDQLNTEHLEQSVQSTIAQLGYTYFLEEREIAISKNSEGYRVTISGMWNPESPQYSLIAGDLEYFSDSKVQGEPAMCQ